MPSCRNSSAPINNGITNFAVSSAGVTRLGAGCRNIVNSNRSMNVCGSSLCLEFRIRESSLKFCINAKFLVRECAENIRGIAVNISDLTHINVNLYVIRPESVGIPIGFCGITFNVNVSIIVYYTNRKCCKYSRTGLSILSGTCDNDRSSVIFYVDRIFCGKAICQDHIIKLEVVSVVKIDNCLYRLNGFDLVCVHIHPVNRTAIKIIKSRICGNELNRRCIYTGSHLDESDNNRLITHIITDLKLNTVNTISNCNVANSHSAVCKGYRNLNTVNVSLCACSVQAGCVGLSSIFCNSSSYGKHTTFSCNSLILFKCDTCIITCKLNLAKYRSFSILYCIREVSGNVINVNGLQAVYSTVCLPKSIGVCMWEHKFYESEIIRIILGCIISNFLLTIKPRNENLFICTYVNRKILPTGLIPRIIDLRLVDNGDSILLFVYTVII